MFHPKGTSFGRREIDDGKPTNRVSLSGTYTRYPSLFHYGVVVFSVR